MSAPRVTRKVPPPAPPPPVTYDLFDVPEPVAQLIHHLLGKVVREDDDGHHGLGKFWSALDEVVEPRSLITTFNGLLRVEPRA